MKEDLNIDKVLHEIFGFFKSKLYAIESGTVREVVATSDGMFEEIQSKVSSIPSYLVTPFVGTLLDRVNDMSLIKMSTIVCQPQNA
ncbi:MAG: hypothetical protein WDM78_21395 [Puia sp.]